MDYLEKGSPVRQNIRQDVYNSTNFVGRVDTQSLESKSISTESLNIDLTDTLSYVTEEDYELSIGKEFLGSWQNLVFTGDVLGSVITSDNHSIFNIIGDGETEIDPIGLSFPDQLSGQLLKITSGDLSGSSLSNLIKYSDDTLLGGDERFLNIRESIFVDPSSGDVTEIIDGYLIDPSASSYEITKTNDSGEIVKLEISDSESGFKLSNDLADSTASVLRIEDNNGDAILEFFNDYLVSETIPALDYADDAAAALGGVPVGGIYHNSGTIRIRLT